VTETNRVVTCGFCLKPSVGVFRDVNGVEKCACTYHGNVLLAHPKWQRVE